MTFTDISNRVLDRMNLTSAAAIARIALEINERYREVASGVGLNVTALGIVPVTATTTIGQRTVVFAPAEKILAVYNTNFTPPTVLDEVSLDELRNQPVGSDPARQYAIVLEGASSVTIYTDSLASTVYTLTADVQQNTSDLSGVMVPQFPQDFHDIIVHGVVADELYKMEKYDLADAKEAKFEKRLGELRLYIAASISKDLYQGKTAPTGIQNQLI